MQVSVATLIGLLGARNDALRVAVHSVLGARAQDESYALSSADADAIASHLDAQAVANTFDACAAAAEVLGVAPSELQLNAARDINEASMLAMRLFALAGLGRPGRWAE